jgi:tetratricopeptide (TPR) repeat protein
VTTFGVGVAAAASGTEIGHAAELLETLVETNLLEEVGDDAFRYHDLLRLHARDQATADSAEEQRAVIARTVGWYVRATTAADLRIMPARWHLSPQYELSLEPPVAMETSSAAVAWLEAELGNIRAILHCAEENRLYDAGWQICEALWGLFTLRKHYGDWIDSHQVGLRCAQRLSDPRAEARMRIQLGGAYRSLREYDQALEHFEQALELERRTSHRLGEGTALDQLGVVLLRLGRADEAIERFAESRAIHEEVGVPRGVALMDHNIGKALAELGRLSDALDRLEMAEERFHAIGEPYHRALALTAIAQVRIRLNRPTTAAEPLKLALTILTDLDASYDQAHVRVHLAELAMALGRTDDAREHLQHSFALFKAVGAPHAEQIRTRLRSLGPPPAARG